jgi:predicted transcriptional regulator of viral defense system
MKNAKTLGPAATGVLLRLAEQGKKVFSVADAQAIYKKNPKVTANLLRKLAEKGWLVRLKAGKYLIVPLEAGLSAIPMADRYVIAGEILGPVPYYISHYSAMELHQMTTQPAHTVYATVPRQRQGRVIAGVEYYFVYASERFFWGWSMMWVNAQDQVPVSDLEKTVLDCAVRPQLCGGLAQLGRGLWQQKDTLDENRLVQYVERVNHKAAAKRIGFLLETYGLGRRETIDALQSLISRGYDLLDPTLASEGPHRPRWRVRVNLDPEELKAAVWS